MPTLAARAARSSTGPAAVLTEAFRRYGTGERADARIAELRDLHVTFQLREVICQDDRHALHHGVWIRELPGGGGSAGRFWALATVIAGRIAQVEYVRDRAAAERLLAGAQRAHAAAPA